MNIGIAILSYRSTPVSLWPRFMAAESYCAQKGIRTALWCYGHALVHQARNASLCEMPDVDYLVFVDDDMWIDVDSIYKLVTQDAPVVSGLCTTRRHPVELAAAVWDDSQDAFVKMNSCTRKISGKFATGAAFLAIRRDAIDKLVQWHLSGNDWLADNRKKLDRMHVRAEYREKERARIERARRLLWERTHTARIFDFPVDDESEVQLGEDIALGLRLIQNGIPVTIDPMIAPRHVGEYGYSIADLEPQPGWRQTREASVIAQTPSTDELIDLLKQAS